jgi:hypothetical protein
MDRVVYILGAGFSAPLGIPVMSNFRMKAKDLLDQQPQRYAHFNQVFETIRDLNACKNYYDSDLFNIEEILSILEMQEGIRPREEKRSFVRFLSDVVHAYTPPIEQTGGHGNWYDEMLPPAPWRNYAGFVASLLGLKFSVSVPLSAMLAEVAISRAPAATRYGIISLNYDEVLERACGSYRALRNREPVFRFETDFTKPTSADHEVLLAKLHGTIHSGDIIPPTWNKSLHPNLLGAWQAAQRMLARANHIRFLGYSLPASDAYIKYLLKAGSIESGNLKQIDVICRDNGRVRERYTEFIKFNNFRFKDEDVSDYLGYLIQLSLNRRRNDVVEFTQMERAHEGFMESE